MELRMILPAFFRLMHMLELRVRGIDLRFSLLFPAALVVLLTLDPTGIPGWCVIASAMHEMGHFFAIFILGNKPSQISVGIFGVRVVQNESAPMSYAGNVFVSLAGPLVNAVTFFVLWIGGGFTMPALVHLTMAVFNLLPINPLDGGQALYFSFMRFMGEERAEKLCMIVSIVVLIPLATIGFYLLIQSGYNFTLLAVSLYLGLLLMFKHKR